MSKSILHRLSVGALAIAGSMAVAGAAQAAAPSNHWGTFTVSGDTNACYSKANFALHRAGLNNIQYGTFGQSSDTSVVVICFPGPAGSSYAAVVASSTDSGAAEAMRNYVRTLILE